MASISCNFFSHALKRNVSIHVILPTDSKIKAENATQNFRTFYLLHGIYGDYTSWLTNSRIRTWAEKYKIAVVMPSGENHFYIDKDIPGMRFGTFIKEELIDFTRRSFPLSKKRSDTYIGGLSMGGYGALINGLQAPDTFSKIVGLSSAVILQGSLNHFEDNTDEIIKSRKFFEEVLGDLTKLVGSKNDYLAAANKINDLNLQKPDIFLACGTEDYLYDRNVRFKDEIKSLGFNTHWISAPGVHNWDFWDTYILEALKWLTN